MKLHALTLRALALGCTALVPTQTFAQVQDFTVTDAQTSTYTVSGGGTGTVSSTGSIKISTDNTNAIIATDGSSTARNKVSVYGKLESTGISSTAVLLGEYSDLVLAEGGTISATRNSSYGIDAALNTTVEIAGAMNTAGAGIHTANATNVGEQVRVLITATGSVKTTGTDPAPAIDLGQYGYLETKPKATIATTGARSVGIYANGNTTIVNAGNLSSRYHGIYLDGTDNKLTQSGTLTTFANGSSGIHAHNSGNAITLSETAEVTTVGVGSIGVWLENSNSLTTIAGAKIQTSSANSNAINALGSSVVSNAGSISTNGGNAYGIFLKSGGNVVTHSGSISTKGSTSFGISTSKGTATSFDTIKMTGQGSIATTGDYSVGAYLGDFSVLTMEKGTSVSTGGKSAFGIYAESNASVGIAGKIATSGSYSHGIILNQTGNVLTLSGSVETSDEDSDAIKTGRSNEISLKSGASVATGAQNSFGISMGDDAVLSIEQGASVSTTGTDAHAVQVRHNATVTNAGTISTKAYGSNAVYIWGNGGSLVNTGTIATEYEDSTAIIDASDAQAADDGTLITLSGGAVSTLGARAYGVFQGVHGTLDIDSGAVVETAGQNAHAVYMQGTGLVKNSGAISTSGSGAHGIYAEFSNPNSTNNSVIIEDGGSVTTNGAGSHGVYLGKYNTLVVEAGGHIETNGVGAYAVYALDNTAIVNASTTLVTNADGAHGIYLAGTGNTVTIGSIITNGDNAYGVYSAGASSAANGNKLTMLSGNSATSTPADSITTKGESSYGIWLGDYTQLEIQGGASITTNGKDSHALIASDDTVISNDGTLTTKEEGAYGVSLNGKRNSFTNTGTISTSGTDAIAVYAGPADSAADANKINMEGGTASTSGSGSYGVYLDDFAQFSMDEYSKITTAKAHAVYLTNDTQFTNYGTISAEGDGTVGVYAKNRNVITNYGVISGTDYAIWLDGEDNTVNFMKGMTLTGRVLVSDEDNTFVFDDGLNAQITIDVDNGVEPLHVSGEDYVFCTPTYYVEENISKTCTYTAVDPTGFAMLDELLEDAIVPVFDSVSRRHKPRGIVDEIAEDGLMVVPVGDDRLGRAPVMWARSYGSYRDQAAYEDIDAFQHGLGGLVAGIDGYVDAKTRAGVLLASTTGTASSSSLDIDWQTLFGGVYAGREVGENSILGLTVLAGGARYHSDRTIVDNTSATGKETAEADYDAAFVAPELSLKTSLGPVNLRLAGRYAALLVGDYEEEGSSSNLSVDDRTVHLAAVGATLSLPHRVNDRLTVEPFVGVEGRYASSNEIEAEVGTLGQSLSLDANGEKKVGRLIAGATAQYRAKNSNLTWKLSLKGTLQSDGTLAAVASFGGELRF